MEDAVWVNDEMDTIFCILCHRTEKESSIANSVKRRDKRFVSETEINNIFWVNNHGQGQRGGGDNDDLSHFVGLRGE